MQRRSEIPARRSATQSQLLARRPPQQAIETEEEYDDIYPGRMPTSARRYVDTRGQQVIEQGNRRIIIHNEPPPTKQQHWLLYVGIGMLVTVLLFLGYIWASNWWQNHQLDVQYGMPRTWQTDQVVGHSDSADHPTHFIFLNLNGHVQIIELPGGNSAHARIYSGPTIFSDNAASVPVTAEFTDVNGDGKVDRIVIVGDQRFVYLNDGTQFKPQG